MFLDQRPWIYFWSPFYRWVVTPILRPLLQRIGAVMLSGCRVETAGSDSASVGPQTVASAGLMNLDARLAAIEQRLDTQFVALSRENQERWDALEGLLVSLLSQPVSGEELASELLKTTNGVRRPVEP